MAYLQRDFSAFTNPINTSPTTSVNSSGSAGAVGYGMIAGGVISGLASIAQGFISAKRTKNAYEFNAKMAELQGRMTRLSADIAIKDIRKKAQSAFSTQRALYAKSGVKMEGSPAAVMLNTAKEYELDALYTDISAQYNVGNLRQTAAINRMEGESAGWDAWQNTYKSVLNMGTNYLGRG